ncbi:MAG: ETC complex I subunit [Rhizomicrobium sp.]
MRARIFEPAKSAMQSGKALTKKWMLEFEPEQPLEIDPLMGWTSSSDMRRQVQLEFDTSDEAVAFCKKHNIPYQLFEAHRPVPHPKSYGDNFRFDRKEPWSH